MPWSRHKYMYKYIIYIYLWPLRSFIRVSVFTHMENIACYNKICRKSKHHWIVNNWAFPSKNRPETLVEFQLGISGPELVCWTHHWHTTNTSANVLPMLYFFGMFISCWTMNFWNLLCSYKKEWEKKRETRKTTSQHDIDAIFKTETST